jgi:hypothetical protein
MPVPAVSPEAALTPAPIFRRILLASVARGDTLFITATTLLATGRATSTVQ